MEEKDITLNEYCALHNVDRRTHQLMNRIALHKARQLGLSEPTYSTVFPQGYWKRLHREAQRPDGNSIRYETARNFLRKYRERDNISPDSFFQYMQEHYKGFPSRRRVGPGSDSLVFLYSDLREAFYTLEKAATHPLQPLYRAPRRPRSQKKLLMACWALCSVLSPVLRWQLLVYCAVSKTFLKLF